MQSGQGVILAAGPTGSGKSSTLFGALAELDRDGRNLVTLEDPVEYRLPGANQVQVNPKAGLTFPAALRSVLRQDPDIIMVGEIRDRETAEIAMAAAVTGHLVLSTIHTVDAPGAITRLLNMGVPPYLLAGGLAGVVAQRLVRRLCPRCGGRKGTGCADCPDGYRGRTGIFQVLAMTDALRESVVSGASLGILRQLASQGGMLSLKEDALRKVAEGITSPHEVGRVIQGDSGVSVPCVGCGGEVPTGSLGCPWCGLRRGKTCPCGARLRSRWRFCPSCLRKSPTL
jgi:type II secretory ATPase GspE/PulE/Tfp pilus assembly ATPase PilB-like protein